MRTGVRRRERPSCEAPEGRTLGGGHGGGRGVTAARRPPPVWVREAYYGKNTVVLVRCLAADIRSIHKRRDQEVRISCDGLDEATAPGPAGWSESSFEHNAAVRNGSIAWGM